MSIQTKVTCEVCGKTEEYRSSIPPGWLYFDSGDFCSWACLTIFAAKRAGLAITG